MPDVSVIRLIGQGLGFLGTIAVVIGMQQKKYDRIVLCKVINELLAAVHYIFLGGYTGMVINFASCMTNGVYWYRNKKGKSNLVFQILFGAMFVCLGFLSWQGWISIFVIVAKMISSTALGISSPRVIRVMNLCSQSCWLAYNIALLSIPGIAGDTLIIVSVIVAIARLDMPRRKDKGGLDA